MSEKSHPDPPLRNRLILIASSTKVSSKLSRGLKDLGGQVTIFPVISIRVIQNNRDLDDSIAKLDRYDWIIFTSAHGVEFYLKYLERRGLSGQDLTRCNICAVGPSTAERLADHGIAVNLIPEDYLAEGVLDALGERCGGEAGLAGLRILIPRAKRARNLLPRELTRAGAHVDTVPCYETVLPELTGQERRSILRKRPDLIVFTSSSTVSNFMKLSGPKDGKRLLLNTAVAALGPITAATAASHGKQVEIVPAKSTTAHLIEAILEYFKSEIG